MARIIGAMETIPDDVIEFLAGEIGQIPENVRLGLRAVETLGWRLVHFPPSKTREEFYADTVCCEVSRVAMRPDIMRWLTKDDDIKGICDSFIDGPHNGNVQAAWDAAYEFAKDG